MSNFARDRRSSDQVSADEGSVTKLASRPQRRAFDLIENLELLRRPPRDPVERPLSAVELSAAETLMHITQAMAPSLDEVRDIACRHGITRPIGEVLRNPAVAALVAA